jgi:lysophospholipase L1-like esterase
MDNINEAYVNTGDVSRLRSFLKRAEAGEKLTVGFIGGSITNGSLASVHERCYAARTVRWLGEKYPKAEFTYINAGIGGTTSHYGVARAENDLLYADPDLVVAEFSVNDENTAFYRETYEGLIRRILKWRSTPAVMILHNIMYSNGTSAEDQHLAVGKHYNVPCVSGKSSIYRDIMSGKIKAADITPDGLHPNDEGHRLVSELLTSFMEKAAAGGFGDGFGLSGSEILPTPITENRYERAERIFKSVEEVYVGKCPSEDKEGVKVASDNVSDPYGVQSAFTGYEKGDYAVFEVTGTEIAAQFVRYVKHPACVATAVVDGDEDNAVVLDGNFDETWGDKLDISILKFHGPAGKHRVKITVTEGDRSCVPFRLVSLIIGV